MPTDNQGSTLIARRSDGGERGATVTAFRCVDTGSTVVTNMVKKPFSPITGGKLEVIEADKKMEIASADFDQALAHVGKCSSAKCGVLLYTAKDEVASFVDQTRHCPVCSVAFTPASDAVTAAAELAGPKKTSRTNPNADPELDEDFDGQVMLLDDEEGEGGEGEGDEEDTGIMVDDDGNLVDAQGNYVDAEGNPVDEPVSADDLSDEGDDETFEDEEANLKEAAMSGTLDKSLLLIVNGYMALATDEGIKKPEDFTAVTAALDSAEGTVAKLTGKDDKLTAVKAFQLALANNEHSELVGKVLDTMLDGDKDLVVCFTEAASLFEGQVKPETSAAWNALAAAYRGDVEESAKKPAAEEKKSEDEKAEGDDKAKETEAAADKGKDRSEGSRKDDADKSQEAADKGEAKSGAGDDADKKPEGAAADKAEEESDEDKAKREADEKAAAEKAAADEKADADKPAALGQTLDLDVTAAMDFDPRSLIITPVTAGVFGVFATVGKGIEPVGTIRVENASTENRHMFQGEGKPDLLKKALLATIEQGSDYAPLGFVPITAQVEVDEVVAEHIAAKAEEVTASVKEQAGGSVEDFKQSIQIAAAGMNKGLYGNPLVASLATELKRRGVHNSGAVAARIVTAAADDYIGTVLEKASEFVGQSVEARNAVAKLVSEANANLSDVEDADDDQRVPATAHVQMPSPAEVAAAKQEGKDNVVPMEKKRSSLFSDVGFGGHKLG